MEGQKMAELDRFLKQVLETNASDLHLLCGQKPKLRIHGELAPIAEEAELTVERLEQLLFEIIDKTQKSKFTETNDLDFAYSLEGVARFRCNYFRHKRGPGAVFRIIPTKIKSIADLQLPAVIEKLAHLQKGLVLITGPTGSGKSTTLAALIDLINTTYAKHILTIEDPVEFVHSSKKSLVRQREIGADTKGFSSAMRAALREDVDVVLLGEMRDFETISLAITLAETGQLVFGTLHTSSAAKTIDRIIDVFPPEQQAQIRVMLADSLRGIVAQQLVPTKDGKGRVAVLEILLRVPALSNVIREGKTQQITSVIQGGKAEGMQTLDNALLELVQKQVIGAEEAYSRAQDKEAFKDMLQFAWMEAATTGQTDRIEAVLKEGIHVDAADDSGATALMIACTSGNLDMVRVLIDHDAEINLRDKNGMSALMRACAKDNADAIKALVEAGADVNAKNNSGNTPLLIAGSAGNLAAVRELIAGKAKTDIEDALGCTVLMRAAMAGHLKVAEALVKAKADVHIKDKSDRTALMYALEKGHPLVTSILIEAGSDVNSRGKGGITPLMLAAKGSPDPVDLLLQAGADVNAVSAEGFSAMTFALEKGNAEIIAALIDAGANVNVKARNGMTPLMWAARIRPELIGPMVHAGADVHLKMPNGYTALRYAQEARHEEAVHALIQSGARE
jgi:twitching motility protein PilT